MKDFLHAVKKCQMDPKHSGKPAVFISVMLRLILLRLSKAADILFDGCGIILSG